MAEWEDVVMKVRALYTLHRPSPTFNPTVDTIASLSVPTGDRSIIAVAPGAEIEIDDNEARRLIERHFVEAVR
jgi:hypothetical protein